MRNRSRKRQGHSGNGQDAATLRYGSGTIHGLRAWAALSERGLCCLRFVTAEEANQRPERLYFRPGHADRYVSAEEEIAQLFQQIEEWLDGRRDQVEVALDLTGTPFQQRVWRHLQKIPRGQTWSYAELARRVGNPLAVRAVAGACARNPVAILVPCHRVIAKDGGLGGYGGGLSRKRALLDRERH